MIQVLRHNHARFVAFAAGLATSVFLGSEVSAQANNDQVVIQFLDNKSPDLDATARARWTEAGDGALAFNVALGGLDPGSYDLYVTDLVAPKTTIVVDSLGSGEVQFATPQHGVDPLFDFPVFDETIEIRQGSTIVFQDVFGSHGATMIDGDKTKVGVYMVNVGPDFNAKGKIKYAAKSTKLQFSIEVEDLNAGTYDVLVDGVPVSQITTSSPDPVKISYQDTLTAGKTLLNFDPLGSQIDIVQGTTVHMTCVLPAANTLTGVKPPSKPGKGAKDLGKSKTDSLEVKLMNSGLQMDATGKATLRQSDEDEFAVEVDELPVGDYSVMVGGVDRGTLSVDATGTGLLAFSTLPAGAILLLDFPVKGELIELQSPGGTVLSVVFPTSVQAALGKFPDETFKSKNVEVNLLNAGTDLDANGEITWKLKSSGKQTVVVKARDLAEGTYAIRVNGVLSAAPLIIEGTPYGKGKLTFSSEPSSDQSLLDFDPVDATVEILDPGDVVVLRTVITVP